MDFQTGITTLRGVFENTPDIPAAIGAAIIYQQILARIPEVNTVAFLLSIPFGNVVVFSLVHPTTPHLFLLNAVFFTAFVLSTAIYRLFFHPLARFPGRKLAALTGLYEVFLLTRGRTSINVRELHRKYGDFIRISPDELSINTPEGLGPIYSRSAKNRRGPFYDYTKMSSRAGKSIFTTRDNDQHAIQRRICEQAFNKTAFVDYNPRIAHHVGRLMDRIDALNGLEEDARGLTCEFTFDVVVDLAFGRDPVKHGRKFMDMMSRSLSSAALVGYLRNLGDILYWNPIHLKFAKSFYQEATNMFEERRKMGSSRKDIFSRLLAEDSDTGSKFTTAELHANANTILLAGTDTTATTLAATLRELVIHPEIQQKLRKEIIDAFPGDTEITADEVERMPYVNAVMNESLRLWCAAPTGGHYVTPPQGLTIAGTFIPGNINVRIPPLSVMTDDRYFPRGREYIPERWTNRPELIKDKRAFVPFSFGAHACVGKQLAMNELRLGLANIVRQFDVKFGKSYDDKLYLSEWKDQFTQNLGPLPLQFVKRA